jgi:hypothetical protein
MSSAASFHNFLQLPIEIKIQIWERATQWQEIITISPTRGSSYSPESSRLLYDSKEHKIPALLHACPLSRTSGLKRYKVLSSTRVLRHPIYVYPARNVLYLPLTPIINYFGSIGADFTPPYWSFIGHYPITPDCAIRFVVFEDDYKSLETVACSIKCILLMSPYAVSITQAAERTGSYSCGKCKKEIVPQVYGMELGWTCEAAAQSVCKKDGTIVEDTWRLNIRVFQRWEVDEKFGDGPWNESCCSGYKVLQEGFSSN